MELMHRNSLCIILVNITQTLTCSIMATSPWDMKCNIHGTCEYVLPTDCTNISQWRWHHCSCKTRGMEKHMCSRMTNGTIQTKGPQNTTRYSTGPIPWFTECTTVARRLSYIPTECFDLDILCNFTVTDILKTKCLMTFVAQCCCLTVTGWEIFLFSIIFRPALGPTQPPI